MKKHPVLLALGRNIRALRAQRGLTQEALAEKASLDPTYISGIERGVRNPGIKNIARIAKALNCSTSVVCQGIDA
jgi:transcriptional regulator with XRE-family HTH domain